MAPEANFRQCGDAIDYTADAAMLGGEVFQLKDGRAAVIPSDVASGALTGAQVKGVWRIDKTANVVILHGGRVFFDHSANTATFKKVNDRDFYAGRAVADSPATQTYVDVDLNVDPPYDIDVGRDGCISVAVGTAAAGGFGYPIRLGGAHVLELTATNEAQKIDLMSADGFAIGANAIVEFAFRVLSDGGAGAQDFSIGAASGTHATDYQSVAELIGVHLDGDTTTILVESDDGTTDVAPTTSATTYTEGSAVASRVECWIDMRTPSSCLLYINGAAVATGTTFTLAAASGPLFLIAHLEKTATTDTYKVAVDWLRVRYGQQ